MTSPRDDGGSSVNGADPGIAIQPATNGMMPSVSEDGRPPPARPHLDDVFMQNEGGTRFDPIKEMIQGSGDADKYLMRTVFWDEEDLKDFLMEISQYFRMIYGYSDVALINWLDLMARPGVKGAARTQVERMYIGEREREKSMMTGMLHRARGINKGEEFTPEQTKSR